MPAHLFRYVFPLLSGSFLAFASISAIRVITSAALQLHEFSQFEAMASIGILALPRSLRWTAQQAKTFKATGDWSARARGLLFALGFEVSLVYLIYDFFGEGRLR